jgi:hypothetical protein
VPSCLIPLRSPVPFNGPRGTVSTRPAERRRPSTGRRRT